MLTYTGPKLSVVSGGRGGEKTGNHDWIVFHATETWTPDVKAIDHRKGVQSN
jgi:hypothetical protein